MRILEFLQENIPKMRSKIRLIFHTKSKGKIIGHYILHNSCFSCDWTPMKNCHSGPVEKKQLLLYENVASWKVTLRANNFGDPVYGRVIPLWMKWNPSFHDDYYLTIFLYENLPFWKGTLRAYNFGAPVYKGVVPHECNKIHPSTITTV